MAYIPTNWQTWDIVTAEKLNKLENGIMSGVLYIPVTYDYNTGITTLEASYDDITNAINNGQMVFCKEEGQSISNDNYTLCMMGIIPLEGIGEVVNKAGEIVVYSVGRGGSAFYSYTSDTFMTSEVPTELSELEPTIPGDIS